MGNYLLCTSQSEDVFTTTSKANNLNNSKINNRNNNNSMPLEAGSQSDKRVFLVLDNSPIGRSNFTDDLDETNKLDKIRLMKSSKIFIFGDNRIKVATACYLNAYINFKKLQGEVEIVVGTRDPEHAKNAALVRAGIRLIKADMSVPTTLLPAIRASGADTVLIVSPSQEDRSKQTISGISACKRAGVGHVVVLSQTLIESNTISIFGEQCRQIEQFVKTSRLSYTIVRLPILMDNYLSQLQAMAEYGIFYRPLHCKSKRNSITISDVGTAVGNILLTPGMYCDQTISLNGPLTDCDLAAQAFSEAFGRPIIYEQVSYDSYRETLLEAKMPEWQVIGILEQFRMFEKQEAFCRVESGPSDLEKILRRPPSTVFDLARAAVALSQEGPLHSRNDSRDFKDGSDHGKSEGSEGELGRFGLGSASRLPERLDGSGAGALVVVGSSSSNGKSSNGKGSQRGLAKGLFESHHSSGLTAVGGESKTANGSGNTSGSGSGNGSRSGSNAPEYSDVVSGNMDVITLLRSYSQLNICRNIEATPASDLPPAGLAGVLNMTLIITATAVSPTFSEKMSEIDRQSSSRSTVGIGKSICDNSFTTNEANCSTKGSLHHGSFRLQKEFIEAHPDIERNAGRKYCVVMDGVFSYMPESIIMQGGHTRAIGSTENKSVSLAGFVVRKVTPTRISLAGSRGERLSFLLDATTPVEANHWALVFSAHVEFIDFQAGSRWLF